jgi:hypothetical protein
VTQRLHDLLDSGELGDLQRVEAEVVKPLREAVPERDERIDSYPACADPRLRRSLRSGGSGTPLRACRRGPRGGGGLFVQALIALGWTRVSARRSCVAAGLFTRALIDCHAWD